MPRDSPTYTAWVEMRRRCRPGGRDAAYYAARGITVCERWLSFENFLADMGERPEGLTLDRIDNNRGYEPGNVRWATVVEQRRNQRRTRLTPQTAAWVRELAVGVPSAPNWRMRHGLTCREIAGLSGISPSMVSLIVRGEAWAEAS